MTSLLEREERVTKHVNIVISEYLRIKQGNKWEVMVVVNKTMSLIGFKPTTPEKGRSRTRKLYGCCNRLVKERIPYRSQIRVNHERGRVGTLVGLSRWQNNNNKKLYHLKIQSMTVARIKYLLFLFESFDLYTNLYCLLTSVELL